MNKRFFQRSSTILALSRSALTERHALPFLALSATACAPKSSAGAAPSKYALAPVDGQISRIVPILTPGAAVTTTRAHVHYVVTEYGRTMLLGLSLAERARSPISIAAPPVPRGAGTGRLRFAPVLVAGSYGRPDYLKQIFV